MTESPSVTLDSPTGRIVLTTVILGSAVAMLTATVVNVALPTLAADLDAGAAGQKWIINGYTLTLAALILIGGSLGDRFGRVRTYRVGVVWFAAASLLCATAPNTEVLIACRLLQGVGGALLTPGSLAIIQSTLRPEDRGRGVGAWSGIGGIAGAIGPLVGGLLVEASWRYVFVLNVPIAIAALLLSFRVPESSDPSAKDDPIDVNGALLTTLVLGGASLALIEGPEAGWTWWEITAGLVAIVAAVTLWMVERGRSNAMLPLDLFADRIFATANVLTFAIYGGMGVLFFLLAIQLQVTAGWSPVGAGTAMLPVTVIMLLLSARAGAVAGRIGPKWPLTIGPMVVAVGMVMMTRIGENASFLTDVFPAVVVFGLGLACIVAPVTSTALDAVPERRSGAASGVNNAVARTAGLLFVAAVPGLVGLTGDALSDPEQLDAGFDRAMLVSAAIVAGSGVLGLFLLPGRRPSEVGYHRHGMKVHLHTCPVDGTVSSTDAPTGEPAPV